MVAALQSKPAESPAGGPADTPLYSVPGAANCLALSHSKVRIWFAGHPKKTNGHGPAGRPLLRAAGSGRFGLSFRNLLEAHLLAALNSGGELDSPAFRATLDHFAAKLRTPHPLVHPTAAADAGAALVDRYRHSASATAATATRLKSAMKAAWDRIECGGDGEPVRYYPNTRPAEEVSPRLVVMDPLRRSGRPCIAGTILLTEVVAGRFAGGDALQELADDYGRPAAEIEEAVRYENRGPAPA